MPPAPQGIFVAPGIADYDTVNLSFSAHGTTPSAIMVSTYESQIGGLSGRPFDCYFAFENEVARFPDCILDNAMVDFGENATRVILRILDHRWRWRNTQRPYTVHANRRIGKRILQGTRRSARELAVKLLQAAGEQRIDVNLVPSDDYPEVQITGAIPAMVELENLVAMYGLRPCYSPQDGRVSIVRPGQGRGLPGGAAFQSAAFDPPELPSGILIVGSEVRFQCRWKLEAVAKTKEGKYVRLDDAPYRPSDGWKNVFPSAIGDGIDDEDERKAAEESVLRDYRIKETADSRRSGGGSLAPWLEQFRDRDGRPIRVTKIDQVLPISGVLNDTETLADGTEQPLRAKITGKWTEDKIETRPRKRNVEETEYPGSWSLDDDKGIVSFSEPVYILDSEDRSRGPIKPAELELECTFGVRTGPDQLPLRVYWEARLSNNNSGLRPYDRGQLVQAVKFIDGRLDDGRSDMQRIARLLEAEIRAGFQTSDGQVALYNRIVVPQPDGALQQYSLTVGTNGCTTHVSRNFESSLVSPSYALRRRIAWQNAQLEL